MFVFVWSIKGVNQNKNILQGVNQKNNFTGGKIENDLYYRGGKDLLTLKNIWVMWIKKKKMGHAN